MVECVQSPSLSSFLECDHGNPTVSLVVPAYNEADNIPVLYKRICHVMDHSEYPWELILVDDHSRDGSFLVISALANQDSRVIGIRLSRNRGADVAIMCGLDHARGQCSIFLAADLQDPPELIPELIDKWKSGAQIVGAVRAKREGLSRFYLAAASAYYHLMRNILNVKEIPPTGVDFFLLDRRVIDYIVQYKESDLCICALISWVGFEQVYVDYTKEARKYGRSQQNLGRMAKRVIDSFTSFSHLPLRVISYLGIILSLVGFFYAAFIMVRAVFYGTPVQGWASIMVVILVLQGIQMIMMGIVGEYVWRSLDETRNRPFYMVEKSIFHSDDSLHKKSDSVS